MDFKQLISRYFIGNLSDSQLPGVAYKALEEGYNSPSLLILAGLGENDSPHEAEKYFTLSLTELNIPTPSVRLAALQYASAIADEILNGEKDVFGGIMQMQSTALDKYDFNSENKKYVYDSIYFEEVYGLFVEYDDLTNEWVDSPNNPDLTSNTKIQMFEALKKWQQKIKIYFDQQDNL